MPRKLWTGRDDAQLRAWHATGRSAHGYAREHGWSSNTVSRAGRRLGLVWSADRPAAAQQAVEYNARASRARRRAWAMEIAARTVHRMTDDEYATLVKGEGGAEHTRTLAFVPAHDWHRLASSLATMSAMLDRLDTADGGPDVEAGVAMLTALGDALRTVAADPE